MNIFKIDANSRLALGEQLWQLRRRHKMRLASVSRQTNIPLNIIDRIECGRYFSYHDYGKLAKLYHCKLKISLE